MPLQARVQWRRMDGRLPAVDAERDHPPTMGTLPFSCEFSRSVNPILTSRSINAIDAASTRLLHAIDATINRTSPRDACPDLTVTSLFEVGLKRPSAARCDAIAARRLGNARDRSSSAPGREAVVSWRARRA